VPCPILYAVAALTIHYDCKLIFIFAWCILNCRLGRLGCILDVGPVGVMWEGQGRMSLSFFFFWSPVNFVGIFCVFGTRRTDSLLRACLCCTVMHVKCCFS